MIAEIRSRALRVFVWLVVVNAGIAILAILGAGSGDETTWQVLGTTLLIMAASLGIAAMAAAMGRVKPDWLPSAAGAAFVAGVAMAIVVVWIDVGDGAADAYFRTMGVLLTMGVAGLYGSLIAIPRLPDGWGPARMVAWNAAGALAIITLIAILGGGASIQLFAVLAVILATATLVVVVGARSHAGRTDVTASSTRFTPIVGTLVYLYDRDRDAVLMIRRTARADDDHYGKVNGLGGKVEPDEGVVASLRREIREEAGVELTSLALRGTVTWTNFGPKREQWLGFVFLAHGWSGTPPAENAEGTLEWIDRGRLLAACSDDADQRRRADLPMWAGDRHFVPLVFDDDPRAFHGTMPYDGDVPRSWTYERL